VVMDICKRHDPEFREVATGHFVACHRLNETEEKFASSTAAPEENELNHQGVS